MGLFDWFKEKFSPNRSITWRDAFPSNIGNEMSSALRKELTANGNEEKIINSVLSEFHVLHSGLNISDDIIRDIISRSLYGSSRVPSLAELLINEHPELSKKELEKVAGDLYYSTMFNRNKYRALSLGLLWYRWAGTAACPQHKHLKDVFVRWDTPPSIDILKDGSPIAHHAGTQWGCKCYAETVVEVKGMYKPPYKVCLGNEIIKMNQRDFLKIFK